MNIDTGVTSVEELEETFYTMDYIEDTYLVPYRGDEYHGWVASTIEEFAVDEEEQLLAMYVSVPYQDTPTKFLWGLNGLENSSFQTLCHSFDIPVSQFRELEGETLWLVLSSITIEGGTVVESEHGIKHYKHTDDTLVSPPGYRHGSVERVELSLLEIVTGAIIFILLVIIVALFIL